MMLDTLPALALFALVTSVTPGPNNLMLMASGANFGFRRTVPHMLGVSLGFVLLTFVVGVGLAGLFQTYPLTRTAMEVVSVFYMLWLAWKIAHAAAPKDRQAGGTPMTFLQAAAFQWVNPKAWAMATNAVTLYMPDRSLWAVALVALIFGAINLPSVSLWTLTGQQLRRVLTNPRRLTIFNWTMAGLLVLSLAPVLWH
ncbi:MAG: LysE family translocator [Rhodobacter sp.]|jgi:threonine/homoserine/homoserine lactone efflux protein|nr:LysE family translocator [Rhodobacter sp.]MCA3487064.1 LysE family translocator [Rhodobacter sp.]MCA3493844.1 LysE family translocator [Rhodobacter sp.]MCA3499499.1 LysE family translocator [Rhodobacter sp.]MCA3504245.1 LysE family translocator [Rhodobacter sp.]